MQEGSEEEERGEEARVTGIHGSEGWVGEEEEWEYGGSRSRQYRHNAHSTGRKAGRVALAREVKGGRREASPSLPTPRLTSPRGHDLACFLLSHFFSHKVAFLFLRRAGKYV